MADGERAMAELRLAPPVPFDFKDPDSWPRWQRRFEQYRVASGLSTAAAGRQVSTFIALEKKQMLFSPLRA